MPPETFSPPVPPGCRPRSSGRRRIIGSVVSSATSDAADATRRCLGFAPWRTRRSTSQHAVPDVQSGLPATQVSLSRVGVTGVEKVIRVRDDGRENLFYAEMECFVDLEPRQAGVHMSRFEEIVGEAIDEVVLGEAFKAEVLAAHVAEKVRERQNGQRAEVSLTARYPETVATPESGDRHPGDLRPLRHRGRLGDGDADADRRPGPGDDRLPLRAGDGHRALARTARRGGLRRRADRARSSTSSRSPPTTSAASAPSTSAAPTATPTGSRRRSCCGSSRAR